MVMPTIQNCPKCGDKFMGSDTICDRCRPSVSVVEMPCPLCQGDNNDCQVCRGNGHICGITKIRKEN